MKKTVGGVAYSLLEEGDTSSYGCLSNCVYTKDVGGGRFCFGKGDLEVVCGEGEYSVMTVKLAAEFGNYWSWSIFRLRIKQGLGLVQAGMTEHWP